MLQRKRTGMTSVSPCIRPIQTKGGHQYSERKCMYFFLRVTCAFILMALSCHGRWKQLRITSDKNIRECRLILSADFRRGWERRHALDFLQVRTSNPVWQLLLYSLEYNWEHIQRSHNCKTDWHSGQKITPTAKAKGDIAPQRKVLQHYRQLFYC